MRLLEKLTVRNFKSIREQVLDLRSLNVFIGSNGSGKSNLTEIFRFLWEIVNQNLAGYVARKGGADTLLHFGRKHSPNMELFLESGEGEFSNSYRAQLEGTVDGGLYIQAETAYYHDKKRYPQKPFDHLVAAEPKNPRFETRTISPCVRFCEISIATAYITRHQRHRGCKRNVRCRGQPISTATSREPPCIPLLAEREEA